MLVQNLSFDGETIIIPLLLNVYQSPLPGTEPKVAESDNMSISSSLYIRWNYISSSIVTFDGAFSLIYSN